MPQNLQTKGSAWVRAEFYLSAQSIAAVETMVKRELESIINRPEDYYDADQAIETIKILCEEMGFNFKEIESSVEPRSNTLSVNIRGFDGSILGATTPKRARELIQGGYAVIYRMKPFAIRLIKKEDDSDVQ